MNEEFVKLRDYVLDRRRYCVNYRVEKFDPIWQQALQDYDARPFQRSSGTNLNLPELYVRVEIMVSHLLADFYGYTKSPLIPFSRSGDTHQKDQKLQMAWEYQAHRMNFVRKMQTYFRTACLLGTGIAYVGWDRQYKNVRRPKPWNHIMGVPLGKKNLTYNELIFSGPVLNILDPMTCWADPDATECDIQSILDFGYDRWITQSEMEAYTLGDRPYFSPEKVKSINWQNLQNRYSGTGNDVDTMGADERKQILGYMPDTPYTESATKQIFVTEWWGFYDFGNGPVSCLVTIADPGGQNVLLRPFNKTRELILIGNNDYFDAETGDSVRPFVAMPHIPKDFCFWGRGQGEVMHALNEEFQELVNLRLKNVNMAMDGIALVNYNQIVNPTQVQITPGAKWDVKGSIREAVQFVKFPDITPSINNQIAEIEQSADEVTGVDAIMRSAPANLAGRTPISASEASMRQGMSSRRFKFIADSMMAAGPVQIAEMTIRHMRQFMEGEEMNIRVLRQSSPTSPIEPEYTAISKDDLHANADFFFVGDPMRANENVLRANQIAAAGLFLNPAFLGPPPPGSIVDIRTLGVEICKAVEWPTNVLRPEAQLLQEEIERMTQSALQSGATLPQAGVPPSIGPMPQGSGIQPPAISLNPGEKGNELPPIPGAPSEGPGISIPEEGGVLA